MGSVPVGPRDDPHDPILVRAKLRPPPVRAGLVHRGELEALLEAGVQGKLCLLDAPAGSGKTTLLAQWRASSGGARVAWVSLDEGDNDPTRFWVYLVEALRGVDPAVGGTALEALEHTSSDLRGVVLPLLLNDLGASGPDLFLVLDDYHLVTEATCHQTLTFFLDHLPGNVHLVVSTRADPPLPLASMRARGELAEIRVGELRFTTEEASDLLNSAMRLQLSPAEVDGLAERTEGWAAGLYLAGLSLRGRPDAGAFIASFTGDNRHVADYLGAEVLARQPEAVRTFLLRTSVVDRLSGPLCDAVLAAEGSADVLRELERSNLFLVPLDDHRRWYRYHHLFAQLLRLELGQRDAALVPALHRRAAAWHGRAGNVDEAIHHTTAAGDYSEASALIALHWLVYWRSGRSATLARWLDALPEEAIVNEPPAAFVAAWVRGFRGASKEETARWLATADDATYEGPPPAGAVSTAFGVALTRATLMFDDVAGSVVAGRRALELAGPGPSPFSWMAVAALAPGLYLSGRPDEARAPLEDLVRHVPASAQPFAVVNALAVLSLISGDEDAVQAAWTLAERAVAAAEAQGLGTAPLCGLAHLAMGRALTGLARLAEAEKQLERALEILAVDSVVVHRAFALLLLAPVRRRLGDVSGARRLVEQAREMIAGFTEPGVLLPGVLEQVERSLTAASPRQIGVGAPLTERELAVLRLLSTALSKREIGRELFVSENTVRTHVQAVYRKLEVATRAEAVQRAGEMGLIPRRAIGRSARAGLDVISVIAPAEG
jgi:LuxR family maltose regulon positive regulatory protein